MFSSLDVVANIRLHLALLVRVDFYLVIWLGLNFDGKHSPTVPFETAIRCSIKCSSDPVQICQIL